MSTSLFYALTTDPFPLQASPQNGGLNSTQVVIVATNNTDDGVTLQGIIVQLPEGDGAQELMQNAAGVGAVPPANWSLQSTTPLPGCVKYLFYPPDGQQTLGPGQSLTFVFDNVQVNTVPGTCTVSVVEGSDDCDPNTDCPQASLDLTKFPAGWGTVQFWADPSIVAYGGETVLYWTGPAGATYTIDYYTPAGGPVQVPAPGQPALSNQGQYPAANAQPLQLTENTTFNLTVTDTVNGQTYNAGYQVTTLAVSRNGQVLYAIDYNSSSVSLLKTETGKLSVISDPHLSYMQALPRLAVAPDGGRAYVACNLTNSLVVIDTPTEAVVQVLQDGGVTGFGLAAAVASNGKWAFVTAYDETNGGNGSVLVIDIETAPATVVQTLPVQQAPTAVAASPDGLRFYVANRDSKSVSVFQATLAEDGK